MCGHAQLLQDRIGDSSLDLKWESPTVGIRHVADECVEIAGLLLESLHGGAEVLVGFVHVDFL